MTAFIVENPLKLPLEVFLRQYYTKISQGKSPPADFELSHAHIQINGVSGIFSVSDVTVGRFGVFIAEEDKVYVLTVNAKMGEAASPEAKLLFMQIVNTFRLIR